MFNKIVPIVLIAMIFLFPNNAKADMKVGTYKELCLDANIDASTLAGKAASVTCFYTANAMLSGLGYGAYSTTNKQNNFFCLSEFRKMNDGQKVDELNQFLIRASANFTAVELESIILAEFAAHYLRRTYPIESC